MEEKKVYLAAIVLQAAYAGVFLLSKSALNKGIGSTVFVFYTHAASFLFQLIITIIFKKFKCPTCKTFYIVFALALCGLTLSSNLFGYALVHTSAVLAAATMPVITFPVTFSDSSGSLSWIWNKFIRCICCRWICSQCDNEDNRREAMKRKAKLVGIIVCIAGVAILAFYKGPNLKEWRNESRTENHSKTSNKWILAFFLMLIADILLRFYLGFQDLALKCFPDKYFFVTLQSFLSTILSFLVAIAFERNHDRWKLGLDIKLVAVTYCGIVVPVISFYLRPWCDKKKAQDFIAMWNPLSLIITILCSAFILGESIPLGSLLGGILLIGGIYFIIWGKNKD